MKILSAVLGAALLAVCGMAFQLSRQVEAGRQQIAALKSQNQELQAVARLETVPDAQSAEPIGPPVQVTQTATGSAPATAASLIMVPTIEAMRAQMASPEGMARRKETNRMLMRSSNPGVEVALELGPEERDRLLELLAAQQDRSSAIFDRSSLAVESEAQRAKLSAELEEHRRTSETELQALLGTKYPQWQDYQQTRGAWSQGRDLRAVLEAAGTPFTTAQERALINALAEEQRSFNQTPEAARQPFTTNTPERQQRRLDAAAPHLSPQQLQSYREMLERATAQQVRLVAPPPQPGSTAPSN